MTTSHHDMYPTQDALPLDDATIHTGDPFRAGFIDFPLVRADQAELVAEDAEATVVTDEVANVERKISAQRLRLNTERLPILLGRVGIVPSSNRELDIATYALRALDESPDEGFVQYLNPVKYRRVRDINTANPVPETGLSADESKIKLEHREERVRRTMAKIIGEVEAFAQTSGNNIAFLNLLLESLEAEALEERPQAIAFSESSLSVWKTSPDVKRALKAAMHSETARQTLDESEPVDLDIPLTDEEIKEYLLTHTVEEVHAIINRARGEQFVRHHFWLNRLREASRQGAAEAIATASLARVIKQD